MSAKRRVLLVDDSPIVRAVALHALAAADFEASAVEDPRGLAEAVARLQPEIVLVDATYPDVTDDDLVAAVRAQAAALPVVFFSDRPEHEIEELVAKSGARGHVPKDAAGLAARLKALLG